LAISRRRQEQENEIKEPVHRSSVIQ